MAEVVRKTQRATSDQGQNLNHLPIFGGQEIEVEKDQKNRVSGRN